MAESKWGSNIDNLNKTYKSYIRPVLKFGVEILSSTSKNNKIKIETCQNKMLWIILEGVKTTLIPALLAVTINNPDKKLSLDRMKNLWLTEDKQHKELKTQIYFITKSLKEHQRKHEVNSKLPPMNSTNYAQTSVIEVSKA